MSWNGRVADKINANKINKELRRSMFNEQKQQIRRKIKSGNLKTLWDTVKIATDINLFFIHKLET